LPLTGNDLSIEFAEKRIAVVEPLGQLSSLPRRPAFLVDRRNLEGGA
jgi:hypothetical protein